MRLLPRLLLGALLMSSTSLPARMGYIKEPFDRSLGDPSGFIPWSPEWGESFRSRTSLTIIPSRGPNPEDFYLNPKYATAEEFEFWPLWKKQKLEEAEAVLAKGCRLHPRSYQLHGLRALLLQQLGRKEDLRKHLETWWETENSSGPKYDLSGWESLGLAPEVTLSLLRSIEPKEIEEALFFSHMQAQVLLRSWLMKAVADDPAAKAKLVETLQGRGLAKPEWWAGATEEELLKQMDLQPEQDGLAGWFLGAQDNGFQYWDLEEKGGLILLRTLARWRKEGKPAALFVLYSQNFPGRAEPATQRMWSDTLRWAVRQKEFQGQAREIAKVAVSWMIQRTLEDWNGKRYDFPKWLLPDWGDAEWESLRKLVAWTEEENQGYLDLYGYPRMSVRLDYFLKARKGDVEGLRRLLAGHGERLFWRTHLGASEIDWESEDLNSVLSHTIGHEGCDPKAIIPLVKETFNLLQKNELVRRRYRSILTESLASNLLSKLERRTSLQLINQLWREKFIAQPELILFWQTEAKDRPYEYDMDAEDYAAEVIRFTTGLQRWFPREMADYLPVMLVYSRPRARMPGPKEQDDIMAFLTREATKPESFAARAMLLYWRGQENRHSELPTDGSEPFWKYFDNEKLPPALRLWWARWAGEKVTAGNESKEPPPGKWIAPPEVKANVAKLIASLKEEDLPRLRDYLRPRLASFYPEGELSDPGEKMARKLAQDLDAKVWAEE